MHRLFPGPNTTDYTINLYPSRDLLDTAFVDLTAFLNWTRMGIIYEDYGSGKGIRDY